MVSRFTEAEDSVDKVAYQNVHRIDYISEWLDIIVDLKDEDLESPEITKALKVVYDAVSLFEDAYAHR